MGVRRSVRGAADRAENMQPVMKDQAKQLDGMIQLHTFRKASDPYGKRWPALAESTKEARRNKDKSRIVPLVDTGALRGAIVTRGERQSVVFGISGAPLVYGPIHQFGGKAGRKRKTKIHRRAYLPVDKTGTPSFHAGPAKKWHDGFRAACRRWITKGER